MRGNVEYLTMKSEEGKVVIIISDRVRDPLKHTIVGEALPEEMWEIR